MAEVSKPRPWQPVPRSLVASSSWLAAHAIYRSVMLKACTDCNATFRDHLFGGLGAPSDDEDRAQRLCDRQQMASCERIIKLASDVGPVSGKSTICTPRGRHGGVVVRRRADHGPTTSIREWDVSIGKAPRGIPIPTSCDPEMRPLRLGVLLRSGVGTARGWVQNLWSECRPRHRPHVSEDKQQVAELG